MFLEVIKQFLVTLQLTLQETDVAVENFSEELAELLPMAFAASASSSNSAKAR